MTASVSIEMNHLILRTVIAEDVVQVALSWSLDGAATFPACRAYVVKQQK